MVYLTTPYLFIAYLIVFCDCLILYILYCPACLFLKSILGWLEIPCFLSTLPKFNMQNTWTWAPKTPGREFRIPGSETAIWWRFRWIFSRSFSTKELALLGTAILGVDAMAVSWLGWWHPESSQNVETSYGRTPIENWWDFPICHSIECKT